MKFIKDLLERSSSRVEFARKLKSVGIGLDYNNDGSVKGVLDSNGKPYSWKKLGVTKEALIKLDERENLLKIDTRVRRLEFLQTMRDKNRVRIKDLDR